MNLTLLPSMIEEDKMAKIQNVYKDKKTKKWFYKKRLPEGNPTGKSWAIKKGFDTASEAKLALDKYLDEIKKKGAITTNTEVVVLKDFTENVVYNYWKRNLKKSSLPTKHSYCRYIFQYFKGKTFNKIRQKDIANFKDYLIDYETIFGNKLASMSINNTLNALSQIYELACEREIVTENIVKKIGKVSLKNKAEIDYWTLEEFERFLSVIDDTTYKGYLRKLGFYTLFFTGMRVGEMMARKWSDIDWESEAIHIDSTLFYKNVNDWSASPLDGAKNNSSEGWVKLTPKLVEMLKVWHEKQQAVGKMEYIFMLNGTMYSIQNWRTWRNKYVKQWNEQANENEKLKRIRVHDLRDSHGMLLLVNGADLKTIQKRLRHAQATTTMKHYLDRLPNVEDKILQNF